MTSWPAWLRIVSTAIAVLPVPRSPMISSRWPRPIGIIESIAFRPVWSGSFTGWRWMTPGALNSSGRVSDASIGPRPSRGLPSGSTTRPSRPSPTGTEATRPVRRTGSPSMTCSHSPNRAAPTSSSSRLNARPTTPCSSSSISIATAFSRPYRRAMPSPTCRTVPTSARSVSTSYCSIRCLRIDVISSGRSFKSSSPYEVVSQSFQSSADARVDAHRPRLQDHPADQVRIDAARGFDLAAGRALDLSHDRRRFLISQLLRRRELDRQSPLLARLQALELARHLLDLADPVLLRPEAQEVAHEVVGAAEQVLDHRSFRRRLELRIAQDRAQLRHLA